MVLETQMITQTSFSIICFRIDLSLYVNNIDVNKISNIEISNYGNVGIHLNITKF